MKIGWIGAGIMGSPMVMHLIDNHFEVHVYARHVEKIKSVLDKGAVLEKTIKDLVQASDVICTMVGFPTDVKEVYEEIFKWITPGKVCIDFTTSSPKLAEELSLLGEKKYVDVLDAPVTGGDVGAKNGTLTVLVGGKKDIYEKTKMIFEAFGKDIYYCGKAGNGQYVKIANQIMIANNLQGICEAYQYLSDMSVDENMIISCLKNGAAGSRQLDLNGQKMFDGDYAPGFYVKHFIKDLKIATNESKIPLTGVNTVINEYLDLVDRGYSEKGTQCLIEYFK